MRHTFEQPQRKTPLYEQQPGIAQARVKWLENGAPFSEDFDDIFFHREDGLEETKHVFLACNQLPERWQKLNEISVPPTRFVVAELGFGTGLNILAAAQLWEQTVERKDHQLHLITHEIAPFSQEDLARGLELWPQLGTLRERLISSYPLPVRGVHRLRLAENILLTLVFGSAAEFLEQNAFLADAWFLDGFAPSKNESLWNEKIARLVGEHSNPGATFATYTAAGHVRRALQGAGFKVVKLKGFAYKREMSTGRFQPEGSEVEPSLGVPRKLPRIIVVGGGIAGCSAARALAERGCQVTLLEAGQGIAFGASGNKAAVLMPSLTAQPTARMALSLTSLLFTRNLVKSLQALGHNLQWNQCGVLRLASHAQVAKLIDRFAELELHQSVAHVVQPDEIQSFTGVNSLASPALYFPFTGFLSPVDFCQALVEHPFITVHCNTPLEGLEQISQGWRARTASGEFEADSVVLASGHAVAALPQTAVLPLGKVRGQVLHLPPQPSVSPLKSVLCSSGYLTPELNGQHLFGATYERGNETTEPDLEKLEELAETLLGLIPDAEVPKVSETESRASFRCTSPDRVPLVGPVPNSPGLYVSTAHGSHGFSTAPLAAELLAAMICDEVLPCEARLAKAVGLERYF